MAKRITSTTNQPGLYFRRRVYDQFLYIIIKNKIKDKKLINLVTKD